MANKMKTKMAGIIATLLLLVTLLAACGSPSEQNSVNPSTTLTPQSMATPSPDPTPTQVVTRGDTSSILARGEDLFQRTAGNVGCQYCHGVDARGKVGPDIRGKSTDTIKQALGLVVPMTFIMETTPLSEEDIEALAAYLKHLESQP